ncbi:MAG: ABC transporter ATP-binding protein [Gaiellales bacterium]|nr:MAG: ABC transporter ATP-binding protein [Gaiellales bacterium]
MESDVTRSDRERCGECVVAADGLTKRYPPDITAVDNLSISVFRGEVYGFIGPNGAGKTTTLRMILGLVRPTAGSVVVLGGRPGSPDSLARIGAIVEAPAFYPYLSGRNNLRVLACHAGVSEGRIEPALVEVGLAGRADDRFKSYSMGMKQRLGMAAALLKDPELLILDEPTNGLDPEGIAEMRTLIRSLGAGQRTVLLSSHLMGEMEQVCDRIGVVRYGRVIYEGTLDELRGGGRLKVRARPVAAARELLKDRPGGVRVSLEGEDTLLLEAGADEAEGINRLLVEAGVEVSELCFHQPTLEDVYLDLIEKVDGGS